MIVIHWKAMTYVQLVPHNNLAGEICVPSKFCRNFPFCNVLTHTPIETF